jgi:hypothetical protein
MLNNVENKIGNESDIELNAKNEIQKMNDLVLLRGRHDFLYYKIKKLNREIKQLEIEVDLIYDLNERCGFRTDDSDRKLEQLENEINKRWKEAHKMGNETDKLYAEIIRLEKTDTRINRTIKTG